MLATGVTVACRVRPPGGRFLAVVSVVARASDSEVCLDVTDDSTVTFSATGGGYIASLPTPFQFDRVFSCASSNEDVFNLLVRPVVVDVAEGYNGSVLAYGQTGSGKTYTIAGISPMIANSLFDLLDADDKHTTRVTVSCVELYLERVNDLCDSSKTNLRLRERMDGSVYVEDAKTVAVKSGAELAAIMSKAVANRITASTLMNQVSSRSHALTVINVTRTVKATGDVLTSELVLADLAGSELVNRTGASGLRLEEAKSILRSLSALVSVVCALAEDDVAERIASARANANATTLAASTPGKPLGVETLNSPDARSRRHSVEGVLEVPLVVDVPETPAPPASATRSRSLVPARERLLGSHKQSASSTSTAEVVGFSTPEDPGKQRRNSVGQTPARMRSGSVIKHRRASTEDISSTLDAEPIGLVASKRSVSRPLGSTARHVPYRDSKLTRLLQRSLGGNAKTALIICASPNMEDAAETMSSLRFGLRAQNVKNTAIINRQSLLNPAALAKELAEAKLIIAEQSATILRLQAALAAYESPQKRPSILDAPLTSRSDGAMTDGSRRSLLPVRASVNLLAGTSEVEADGDLWDALPMERKVSGRIDEVHKEDFASETESVSSLRSALSADTLDIVADMMFDPEAAASWVRDLKQYTDKLLKRARAR